MSEPSPSVAQSLLAELEAGGELVDDGRFSIDASRARDKLRSFQLADPHGYVLLLVEAAILAGADPVRVATRGSVTVEFGLARFERSELEQLFAAAFIDLRDTDAAERARRRALQKLAFACNAALQVGPVELELVDERELLQLVIEPEQDRFVVEARPRSEDAELGLRVRVRGPIGVASREAALIRERCRYSAAKIVVDGEQVSVGHAMAMHVEVDPEHPALVSNGRKIRPLELAGRRVGLVGFRRGSDALAELWILTNGVLAERIELAHGRFSAPGFVAVAELDLDKDLSQTQVVRGPEFDEIMAAVWAAHDELAPIPAFELRMTRPRSTVQPLHGPSLDKAELGRVVQFGVLSVGVLTVIGTGLVAPDALGVVAILATVVCAAAWWIGDVMAKDQSNG